MLVFTSFVFLYCSFQNWQQEKEASNLNSESKGIIRLADIVKDGIELNENTGEFTIKLQSKKVQLKAANGDEAGDWARNIMNWIQSTRE